MLTGILLYATSTFCVVKIMLLPPSVSLTPLWWIISLLRSVLCSLTRHVSGLGLHWYLFVFSVDVDFLGADGLADAVDVILSAVIEDVLILFPESGGAEGKEKDKMSMQNFGAMVKQEDICPVFNSFSYKNTQNNSL